MSAAPFPLSRRLLAEALGTAILVVVTDAAANLGLLRLQAHKINPALQAAVADL